MYTPNALQEELSCWRTIIHLNIVRSIRLIIETLDAFAETSPMPIASSFSTGSRSSTSTISSDADSIGPHQLTLLLRLRPLLDVETTLIQRLGAPHETEAIRLRKRNSLIPLGKIDMWEVHVRPGAWKKSLTSAPGKQKRMRSPVRHKTFCHDSDDLEDDDSIPHVIDACKEAMHELWRDQAVQNILERKRLRLEELPGL